MNVYDKLDKTKALTNADSYMYYASVSAVPISPTLCIHFVAFQLTYVCDLQEALWSVLCGDDSFAAPRADIDDVDPDCNNQACQP